MKFVDDKGKTHNASVKHLIAAGTQGVNLVLPPNCVGMVQTGRVQWGVILEYQPQVRVVQWRVGPREGDILKEMGFQVDRHKATTKLALIPLAMPYVIHTMTLTRGMDLSYFIDPYLCRTFFRNAPLSSFSDPLYRAALKNVNYDGWSCVGNSNPNVALLKNDDPTQASLIKRTAKWVRLFWSGIFNDSIHGNNFSSARSHVNELRSIVDWVRLTQKDPSRVLRIDWEPQELNRTLLSAGIFASSGMRGRRSSIQPLTEEDVEKIILEYPRK